MHPQLDALSREYWDLKMANHPFWASMLGDHRFDEQVPDASAEARARHASALRDIADRAEALAGAGLERDDATTLDVLLFEARNEADANDARLEEFFVSPAFGPQVELLQMAVTVTLPEPEHAEALVARYTNVGTYLDQTSQRLREGVANGRTPPAEAVHRTVEQLDQMLAASLDTDPLMTPTPPASMDERAVAAWRERLADAISSSVRPALQRYRDCLRDEVLQHARPQERSGLVWLPDGEQLYAQAIAWYTTVSLSADDIHEIGLEGVATLADEYRELGGKVLGSTDVAEILTRLRDDLSLRFETAEQVQAQAQRAVARATAAVPEFFGALPTVGCEVRRISEPEAPTAPVAYYMPPATDGTRPGTYFINTYMPETRTRFESEALAFHEALPGHHLQIALAQEMTGLPEFRKQSLVTAYVEGWGLYTERLSDEMGLYSGDLERLGMLSFDSLRAGRLVVDTGMHAKGWSREQAVAYLRDNTPQAANFIDTEVDRYIAWPGQALAYRIGQREIFRVREQARAALGSRFDLRGFHDAVLTPGPVPLPTLARLVDEWVADTKAT